MKVNRSPKVRRKLQFNGSAASTAIDLFASVTSAVAVIILLAAACAFGTKQKLLVQWTVRRLRAGSQPIARTGRTLIPESEAPSTENTFHIEALNYVQDFAIAPWPLAGKAIA